MTLDNRILQFYLSFRPQRLKTTKAPDLDISLDFTEEFTKQWHSSWLVSLAVHNPLFIRIAIGAFRVHFCSSVETGPSAYRS